MANTSVLSGLWRSQVEISCYKRERICCNMLRKVILYPKSKFTPVWKKDSRKHICIGLDRRIYFETYLQCYFNEGFRNVPKLQFNLEEHGFRSDPSHKIHAVLLYHCHIVTSPHLPEEKEACLMLLTADGFLKILAADSGVVLRSVFLSTLIKYRYLDWADYMYTVQLKSTMIKAPPGGVATSRCLTIALFSIHPLELICCLPIDKQIFGKGIADASVNEDLLVIIYSKGLVMIYSLPWILKNGTVLEASLGQAVEIKDVAGGVTRMGAVGEEGFGVPYTIKLTECPPLLFSAKTSTDMGISFGGSPSVYIHNSPNNKNEFHIKSLRSKQSVGVLKTDCDALHPDVAEFHFDDYRRILHISGSVLSCYKLNSNRWENTIDLAQDYKIDFRHLVKDPFRYLPETTSSGRAIKRPLYIQNVDLFTSAVQDVDFENEVDLLYAVTTLPDPSSESNFQCNLYFIDETEGSILKAIPLPTWEPDESNSIYYELDCILHVVRNRNGLSTCYYYRLST